MKDKRLRKALLTQNKFCWDYLKAQKKFRQFLDSLDFDERRLLEMKCKNTPLVTNCVNFKK